MARESPAPFNPASFHQVSTDLSSLVSLFNDPSYAIQTGTDPRLDPVQLTQMAKYLETVYVSGWQCSSTASSSLEPGPDLAGESSIPMTVPML